MTDKRDPLDALERRIAAQECGREVHAEIERLGGQPPPYPNGPERPRGFSWRTALEQLAVLVESFARGRRRR